MMRVPWMAAATVEVRHLVELVSVMPTLAHLAGLTMPPNEPLPLDGHSLLPLMEAAAAAAVALREGGSAAALLPAASQAPPQQALTQFPRCLKIWGHGVQRNQSLPEWQFNDCDDVRREDFTHMGYSIRTERYRFTRWYPWNGTTLRPVWAADFAVGNTDELYDHDGDDGSTFGGQHEASNLAGEGGMAVVVQQLLAQLEKAFGRRADE